MRRKIIGILVCMLLIAATVLPVAGTMNKVGFQDKIFFNPQQPPEPYISIPGNDGLLFDPTWQTTIISDNTLIRAVDMSNQVDVQMTIFEYSQDGEHWYIIGIDEYGGFEGYYLEEGKNIKIGNEGWSVEWDVSDLTEGYYYIQATMIDIYERPGFDVKLVYYDPMPPLPEFVSLQPYEPINGIHTFEVISDDEDIISYELGVWTIASPDDYFEKDNLGSENQYNVGPNGTDGVNRYCVPTAVKNSLHRFVHHGDDDLEPPLPWYPARDSPLNFSDGRYVVPAGGDADLAMARMLSEELGTTPNGGTTSIRQVGTTNAWVTNSITSGIRSYLTKRGVGCDNPNGYTVTRYGTAYERHPDGRLEPWASIVDYNTYESELRRCEDVILDLHRWNAGADGNLGTDDDDIDGGHAVTGRSSNASANPGDDGTPGTADDTNDIDFVDPETGNVVNSEWRNFNGFSGVRYGNRWWLVSGIWSISPKIRDDTEYSTIDIDNNPSDGWSINWDTTTMPDGYYVITATLMDSYGYTKRAGYIGRANMMIEIKNNNPPSAPTIDGPNSGKFGKSYTYTFFALDPDGDDVSYFIDWDDGTTSGWTSFMPSGPPGYSESHTWTSQNTYTIRAKVKDNYGAESDWGELTVTMLRNRATYHSLFLRFLEQFPILQKISLLQR